MLWGLMLNLGSISTATDHDRYSVPIAVAIAVAVIALLTIIFPSGSTPAMLLLDHSAYSIFPYPFTIQNMTYLVFAVGLANLYVRWKSAIAERALVEPAMKAAEEKVLGANSALAIYSIQTNSKKATPELIKVLEQEARLGVGDASVYLAKIYEGGFAIEANPAEALAWHGIIYADLTDADLKMAVEETINRLARKIDKTDFDSLTFVEPWMTPFTPGIIK